MPLRIPDPPSSVTGQLREYLGRLTKLLNTQVPNASYFSASTPESLVTGVAGDLAIYNGPVSTNTRVWQKAGSSSVPSTTSWFALHIN